MTTARKVAIITRTKDRPLLLQRCIRSVLSQSFTDWLHVIINDGGDPLTVDGLVALSAARYGDRVLVIHNEHPAGMQNASNSAIRASESEYLVIHDDDDSWTPLFLEECTRYLDAAGPAAPEWGVVTQSTWILEEIDSWGNVVELQRKDYFPFETATLSQIARRNLFPPIAFLYRRAIHDEIGYFNQLFNELGDWDFNLRFLMRHDIAVLKKKLANYHWRHQSRGSVYGNTVTDGLASHRRALLRMQNHYLREDLRNGRPGLGFLLNISGGFEEQTEWHGGLMGQTSALSTSIGHLVDRAGHFERITSDLTRIWRTKVFFVRMKQQLAASASQAARLLARREQPAAAPAQRQDLRQAVESSRVVSLDIFDTTLLRLVRKPTDVFLYMQEEVRRILGLPTLRFVDVRVAAERAARDECAGPGSCDETTLDQIYDVLRRRLGCEEKTAERIKLLELDTESRLCYANPEMTDLIRRAQRLGRQVVFASDMYLPAGQVQGLLQRNGVAEHPLLLSSELSASKHHGSLFEHLVSQFPCKPEEILHIGDNAHSDVAQPRSRGIAAHHWVPLAAQVPLVDQQVSLSGAWDGDLASSLYTGLVRRRRLTRPPLDMSDRRAFWEMIGYEVIGPLYLAYVTWVVSRARARGLTKLFFLARDGFHLTKVFALLRERYAPGVEARYLFASRRLLNVPRITALDEAALDFLAVPNPCMKVRHFLERIGLDAAAARDGARRHGFQDLDEVVTTQDGIFLSEGHHQGMRGFLRELSTPILELARREFAVLQQYFSAMGLPAENAGIVDIGWQASSLKSLRDLVVMAGGEFRMPAFYFGTWSYAQPAVDAGCALESMYVHLNEPAFRAGLIAESVELLESFFWAPYPSIIGLQERNGVWNPLYGEQENDPGTIAFLELATAAAFEFIEEALQVLPGADPLPPPFGYLDTVLERLWRYPRKEEAAVLGDLALRNSFGGHGPIRHVARVPPHRFSRSRRASLQDAYAHCYWKKGFLVQLSPVEAGQLRL